MASLYEGLASLRKMLHVQRAEALESMAKGCEPNRYWELVGRAKQLRQTIDQVDAQIKDHNRGLEDDDASEKRDAPN